MRDRTPAFVSCRQSLRSDAWERLLSGSEPRPANEGYQGAKRTRWVIVWNFRYPGPHDLFLLILINGVRVAIQPVDDHERLTQAAERLAHEQKCHVKVLPMTGNEMMNFLGIMLEPGPLRPIESLDPEFRKQGIQNSVDLLRDSQEPREPSGIGWPDRNDRFRPKSRRSSARE